MDSKGAQGRHCGQQAQRYIDVQRLHIKVQNGASAPLCDAAQRQPCIPNTICLAEHASPVGQTATVMQMRQRWQAGCQLVSVLLVHSCWEVCPVLQHTAEEGTVLQAYFSYTSQAQLYCQPGLSSSQCLYAAGYPSCRTSKAFMSVSKRHLISQLAQQISSVSMV